MHPDLESATLGTVAGALGVLTLDTIGALASRRFGFRYAVLAPASFLIYGLVGYVAGRYGRSELVGAVAGSLVGLVDATLGWWIAWRIGPGRLPEDDATATSLIRAAGTTVLVATLLGVVGAAIAIQR